MNSIKILATGMYLPEIEIDNKYFNDKFNLEEDWIYKRTGIKKRYWTENEKTLSLAIKAVEDLQKNNNVDFSKVGLIIVSSTNYEDAMPSISFEIQKKFNIEKCICVDILAGCSGYINSIDIAKNILN